MKKYLFCITIFLFLASMPAISSAEFFDSNLQSSSAVYVPKGELTDFPMYRVYGRFGDMTWEKVRQMTGSMKIALLLHEKPPFDRYVIATYYCTDYSPKDETGFVCNLRVDWVDQKWGDTPSEKEAALLDPAVTEMAFAAIPAQYVNSLDSHDLKYWPLKTQWEPLKPKLDRAAANDTDGDGVRDDVDNCPTVPNLDNGHRLQLDTDKDGLGDPCDLSIGKISQSGKMKMMPREETPKLKLTPHLPAPTDDDEDGDGILNSDDDCPTKGGIVDSKGCPKDSDQDGIVDNYDQCPDVPGTAAKEGCPEGSTLGTVTDTNTDTTVNPTIQNAASGSGVSSTSAASNGDATNPVKENCTLIPALPPDPLSILFFLSALIPIALSRRRDSPLK